MRADKYLVEHGHFDTRAKAQAAIAAGKVVVNGVALSKPSQTIPDGADIRAEAAHPYVSRAALKLVEGLDQFGVDPAGKLCLDVGASTGGFTEVLLERGAARVIAVDVGRDQLAPSLKTDPRVLSLEGTDARTLTLDQIGGATPELLVCDASFISLEKVLARPLELLAEGGEMIALFKPQFEVGPKFVGKGGLVKDEDAVERAKENARAFFARASVPVKGETCSPIRGGDGNREYLFYGCKAASDQ
jgi:23S rRNA (cytidine1920-2'-O)/16S rRNA (cytidine1409-2'-O)-methyltransferase